MFITCKRSGGVAGIRPVLTIDTEQLDTSEGRRIEDMVRRLPTRIKKPAGNDRFTYHILVDDGHNKSEHWIGDGQNSPLINLLWDVVMQQRAHEDAMTTKPPN